MIRHILVDFDGVLTLDKRGSTVTIDGIANRTSHISRDEISTIYYRTHKDILRGHIDHEPLLSELDIERNLLNQAFLDVRICRDALALLETYSSHCSLSILTENGADRMSAIVGEHQLNTLFSPIFVTADIGFLKSDEALYQHVCDRLEAVPGECIFIDNQEKNLVIPKQQGMHVIHHESYHETGGDLRDKLETLLD